MSEQINIYLFGSSVHITESGERIYMKNKITWADAGVSGNIK
jgi:hypothetical protein